MASSFPAAPSLNDNSISDTAERARHLLLCCQEIHEEEPRRIAGAQFSRFNLWTSNIGVFSSRHASLDYRLRTAPTAKAAVDGNLEILCKHLLSGEITHLVARRGRPCLAHHRPALTGHPDLADEDLDAFAEASQRDVFDFGLKLLRRSSPAINARVSALNLVESTISTLHQLSLAIRKASNRNSLARVPKLLDVDGGYVVVRELQESLPVSTSLVKPVRFEATAGFEDFLRRILKSRWLRSDEDAGLDPHQKDYRQLLFVRFVASISIRRRQLAYFQNHQAKLAMQNLTKFVPAPQKPTKPNTQPNQQPASPQHLSPLNFKELDIQQPSFQGFIDTSLSETVPSEFQSMSFRLSPSTAAPSSTASSSDAGGLGTVGPFEVPPAPELGPREKEKMCPYCCLVLPAKTFSIQKKSRRWKKHLLEDLQPYLCLFKNCNQPGKTYRTFKDWQAHLSQPHEQDRLCPLPHPDADTAEEQAFFFDTAAQFQDHLNLYHLNLDASSTRSIFQTASQPAVLPQRCFVCLAEQTTTATLQRHLANHLELAFLLALPGRDDIKDSDAVSSGRPSSRTAPSDTAKPQETDLPDLRGLYGDDSDARTVGVAQTLSAKDFAARLSTINVESSAQDGGRLLDTWTSEQSAVQDFVGAEDPKLSKSWRVLILVVIFAIRLRNTIWGRQSSFSLSMAGRAKSSQNKPPIPGKSRQV
jgi:hypothetical protein